MAEMNHGQQRAVEDIERASTDFIGAVRRALGPNTPESKAIVGAILKARGDAVGTVLNPPQDKAKKKGGMAP
jgi:hypothetical protein